MKKNPRQFEQLSVVILSEAKDLGPARKILRFTQDDNVGQFITKRNCLAYLNLA